MLGLSLSGGGAFLQLTDEPPAPDDPAVAERCCPAIAVRGGRPEFSSDGSAVYVDGDRGIGQLRVDTGVAELAIPGADGRGGIAVSPDGRTVLWSDCGEYIELVDVLADPAGRVVDDRRALWPTFGLDGQLAYVRRHQGVSLLVIGARDGAIREVARAARGSIMQPALSGDGASIAFVLGDAAEPGIYLASTAGGLPARRLTRDPGDNGPCSWGRQRLHAPRR